jgi:pyridoxine/pyridoxamine 5'-phosphate oxidase
MCRARRIWTGFRLAPRAIEFWLEPAQPAARPPPFTRQSGGGWESTLLYP